MSLGVNITSSGSCRPAANFMDMTPIQEKAVAQISYLLLYPNLLLLPKRTTGADTLRLPMRACIGRIGWGYLPVA
jgi:hypothetical protein